MKKLSLLLFSVISTFFLSAQTPGTLYHLFGDDGIVMTDYNENGNDDNYVHASVLQDNMKIVLCGRTYSGSVNNIMITRYNAYGSIDLGFGNNGIKVLQFGGSDDWLTDIDVQSDGKIVAAGYSINGNKTQMIALRLNTDGSLDNSFNGDGMAMIDFGPSINSYGLSMGILDDGKIIISGFVQDSALTYDHVAMCRLTPSGFLDNDFGYYGLKTYDVLDLLCYPDEMVIHNDRIILGGVYLNADFERFAVISRYYLDGEVDYNFGNFGYATIQLEGETFITGPSKNGMCVAPDGKILFTYNVIPDWLDSDFALLRLDQTGNIDNTFGTNGKVIHEMDENSYAIDVITQADGKIIACGSYRSPDPESYDFLIMRHLDNGDLDPDFGEAGTGVVISNVSPETWFADESSSVMFCNMDRLLVSGYAKTDHGDPDFAMACYHTGLSVGVTTHEATNINLNVHPNPVFDQTYISFSLDHPGRVMAEIFNATGESVSRLCDENFSKGSHQLRWNAASLPAGIYIISLTAGDKTYTTKVIKTE